MVTVYHGEKRHIKSVREEALNVFPWSQDEPLVSKGHCTWSAALRSAEPHCKGFLFFFPLRLHFVDIIDWLHTWLICLQIGWRPNSLPRSFGYVLPYAKSHCCYMGVHGSNTKITSQELGLKGRRSVKVKMFLVTVCFSGVSLASALGFRI